MELVSELINKPEPITIIIVDNKGVYMGTRRAAGFNYCLNREFRLKGSPAIFRVTGITEVNKEVTLVCVSN